jgi:hypothetical protein
LLLALWKGKDRAFASITTLVPFFLVDRVICRHEHILFHTGKKVVQLYMLADDGENDPLDVPD